MARSSASRARRRIDDEQSRARENPGVSVSSATRSSAARASSTAAARRASTMNAPGGVASARTSTHASHSHANPCDAASRSRLSVAGASPTAGPYDTDTASSAATGLVARVAARTRNVRDTRRRLASRGVGVVFSSSRARAGMISRATCALGSHAWLNLEVERKSAVATTSSSALISRHASKNRRPERTSRASASHDASARDSGSGLEKEAGDARRVRTVKALARIANVAAATSPASTVSPATTHDDATAHAVANAARSDASISRHAPSPPARSNADRGVRRDRCAGRDRGAGRPSASARAIALRASTMCCGKTAGQHPPPHSPACAPGSFASSSRHVSEQYAATRHPRHGTTAIGTRAKHR